MPVMPMKDFPTVYYATLDDRTSLLTSRADTWDPQGTDPDTFGKEWRLPRLSIRAQQLSLSIAVYCPKDGQMSAFAAQFAPPAGSDGPWTMSSPAYVAATDFWIGRSGGGFDVNVNDMGALTQLALVYQRRPGFSSEVIAAVQIRGPLDTSGFTQG